MNTCDNTHSEQLNELFGALSKAQAMILTASKDSNNPFFKSKYADLAAVWDACREPLTSNGLAVIQTIEGTKDAMYIITTLGHSSGQWMRSKLPLMPTKNDHQAVGSSISYGRRYSLSAMVGIVQDDDDAEQAMKLHRKNETKPVDEKKIIRDFMLKVLPQDDPNEEAWINQYLQEHMKCNKFSSIVQSIQKYEDIEKFKDHLEKFKQKNMGKEAE